MSLDKYAGIGEAGVDHELFRSLHAFGVRRMIIETPHRGLHFALGCWAGGRQVKECVGRTRNAIATDSQSAQSRYCVPVSSNGAKRVRDKDGKQRALLEAATEVFAEQGFEAAVTKEIARRAGCSESMLFHYFGDKQGIFEQVVSRQIAEGVTEAEDKIMNSLPDRFVDFVKQLFLTRLVAHEHQDTVPGWDIAGRALSDPAFSLRVMRPNHKLRVSVIAEGVGHYQDLGQVTPHVDPVTVAELLANFTIFTTTVGPRWFGTAEADIRAQIELGARIFAEGVRGSSATGASHRPGRGRQSRSRSGT